MKAKAYLFFLVLFSVAVVFSSCEKDEDDGSSDLPEKEYPDFPEKDEILKLVNEVRVSGCNCGGEWQPPVDPVSWNNDLALAGLRHSEDMIEQDYFSHTSKDGRNPGDRITAVGYQWKTYGENIAYGYLTAEKVMGGWLKSTGHCKNIMNSSFKEMGVGKANTHWTQVFGTHK